MSRVGIKRIDDASGRVEYFSDVRNAMAGALWIWRTLDERHAGRFSMLSPACWALANAGAMSDRDCLVCGFTFDGCYVDRAHLVPLAEALESFYLEHGAGVHPTVPAVAHALRELAADEGARGACFHQTSVTNDPWELPGTGLPFVFGADPCDANGRAPFELFAEYGPEALAARRSETEEPADA